MATEYHLDVVQQIIHYTFRCSDLLKLALTAAGAEEAKPNGNRNLATLGRAALQLAVVNMGYDNSETRHVIHGIQSLFYNNERLAAAAECAGIQRCIKLCEKPGSTSVTVMSGAVRAIIGAAWKDSGSLDVVLEILRRFSLSPEAAPPSFHESVDPLQTLHSSLAFPSTIEPNNHDTLTSAPELNHPADTACTDPTTDPGNLLVPLDSSLENLASGSVLAYSGHDIQTIFDDAASHASRTTPVECSGAPVSPLGTCQRRCESDENELIPDSGTETRARKRPKQQQDGTSDPDTGWLSLFLAEEEERCSGLGLPGPRVTFMNEDTVKNISDLAGKNGDIPAKIVIGISSASATIALQGAIKVLREKPSSHSHSSLNKIPAPERFAAIEMADQQISSLALLKRCHVLRLWEDHCKPRAASRFIMYGGSQEKTCKGAGNPRNIEKNKTIKELLSRVCPDLDEGSSNYARMHEKAKALEKLGRRLYMLSCEYGIGILGLMLEFTDQMLLKPTDADFKQLLRVLDRSQGKEMRAFAEAATPVVNCVLEGTLRNADYFPFELAESSYIAGLPKSSPALLSLLAGHHLQHRSQEALDARRQ